MVILLKRFVTTLIGGRLAYFVWMALFLLTVDLWGEGLDLVLWFLAPSITAAGFTVGLLLFNQLTVPFQSLLPILRVRIKGDIRHHEICLIVWD